MSGKTRAALLKAPNQIELIERTLTVGDDEVLVKNHLVGICGSDKAFFKGQMPPRRRSSGRSRSSPSTWGTRAAARSSRWGRRSASSSPATR